MIVEGIKPGDRAISLASTTLRNEIRREEPNESGGIISFNKIKTVQMRNPLHPKMVDLIQDAIILNFRALGAPRIGQSRIADPDGVIYAQESSEGLGQRLDRYHTILQRIEDQGLGCKQIQDLAKQFSERDGVVEPWYKSLVRAKNFHEENAVRRACAEWADGDSVAAHFGYGIDIYCTEDFGKNAGANSILNSKNRNWASVTHGINFSTLTELSTMI